MPKAGKRTQGKKKPYLQDRKGLLMNATQVEIDQLDRLLKIEQDKNEALISKLIMFRDIVEKKEFDFMNMSDQEKMNAKISKGFL